MLEPVTFLGIDFARQESGLIRRLLDLARGTSLACVLTPNVHLAVRLHRARAGSDYAAVYRDATIRLCDSRILQLVAGWFGVALDVCTGADLTRTMLASPLMRGVPVALVGPSAEQVRLLAERFAGPDFLHIETPPDLVEGPALAALLDRIEAQPWQVLMLCLGAPKQEVVAAALAARCRSGGLMLCLGASVDYLTGRQRRAPVLWQRARCEWLFRLLTQPWRLGRRYAVDAPLLAALVIRLEVAPRLAARLRRLWPARQAGGPVPSRPARHEA